jgi:hypothetical protein
MIHFSREIYERHVGLELRSPTQYRTQYIPTLNPTPLRGQVIPSGNYIITPSGMRCPPQYTPWIDIYGVDGRKYTICIQRDLTGLQRPTYGQPSPQYTR